MTPYMRPALPAAPSAAGIVRMTRLNAHEVSRLRRRAYPVSLVRDLEYLEWGPLDERSLVLGVRGADGFLLATMRGVWAAGREEVAELEPVPPTWPGGPTLVLQRAATSQDQQGAGLNSLLRWHFLSVAIASGVRFLAGVVISGSARTGVMRRIGYEFHSVIHAPNCPFDPQAEWEFAVLDLARHGDRAVNELAAEVADLAAQFPSVAEWSAFLTSRPSGAEDRTGVSA